MVGHLFGPSPLVNLHNYSIPIAISPSETTPGELVHQNPCYFGGGGYNVRGKKRLFASIKSLTISLCVMQTKKGSA